MEVLFQHFAAACSSGSFFGIPTWYKYLIDAGLMHSVAIDGAQNCELINTLSINDWVQVVVLVGLALLDIGLRLAGLFAVGFVIYGGIKYVTSQGQPERTKAAQETLISALVGLIIAVVAAAAVSFIGNRLG